MRDPLIGTVMGPYQLLERLGEGGMGVVYRASSQDGRQQVAIKLLTHNGSSADARKRLASRFLREGQAAATVEHVNVVRVLESASHEGRVYLVMELVDGSSLGSVLDKTTCIDPARTARIGAAIARGLAAIHAKGIVHRDIKPDNILLGHDGAVKITDLGLAKILDDEEIERLTASGVVVGTPLYVAPEAIRDAHRVGPPADIYSLGATLYHMLCGHPPFQGDSPYELMRAHLSKDACPLREINPQVPAWLARLIRRCMEKKAELRPSAREVALALTQGCDVGGQTSRQRGLILSAALILLVCALFIGWRLWQSSSSNTGPTASVNFHSRGAQIDWRIDDADWQRFNEHSPLLLPAGEHRLQLRSLVAGVRMQWSENLHLESGDSYLLTPDWRPQPLRSHAHALPDRGLILVAGQARAIDDSLVLHFAGSYPVVVWNDRIIRESLLEADEQGVRDTGWRVVEWPSPAAYFSRNRPHEPAHRPPPVHHSPPYHIVSASEFLLARADSQAWQELADPTAAVRDLSSAQVRSWEERIQHHGIRLPDRSQAVALSTLLNEGVWFREENRLYFYAAPEAAQAILVVVPVQEQE